jgi:hypothetical protein
MSADYVILAVVAALSVGGGLFLLRQAKKYRSLRGTLKRSHINSQ